MGAQRGARGGKRAGFLEEGTLDLGPVGQVEVYKT